MRGVQFFSFVKPKQDLEKCKRWTAACGRPNFSPANVTKHTYICSRHFVGGAGPSADHPDPTPATFTPEQFATFSKRRKRSKNWTAPPKPRRARHLTEETVCDQDRYGFVPTGEGLTSKAVGRNNSTWINACPSVRRGFRQTKATVRRETQLLLSLKLENESLKEEVDLLKDEKSESPPPSSCQALNINCVRDNDEKCHFYTGLIWDQFLALWRFLGPKHTLWNMSVKKDCKRRGVLKELSAMDQLFLTLIRLRLGLLQQHLADRFCVSTSYVSHCVTTWILFLYHEFSHLRDLMFATREITKKNMPKCFQRFKDLRVIIDATEFVVQSPTPFQQQENTYSKYKAETTVKVLIGIAPQGSCAFVSDAFEGSISDRELTIQSGFLEKINPGDLVMADHDFTIKDLLHEKFADLNIPPFFAESRDTFTAQEELETKIIAKGRSHVERFIDKLKKYRIFQKTIPLSVAPVLSQMVFVGCCLANFQKPIVP